MATMQTILGAGGPIANELAKILATQQASYRLVSRHTQPLPGAETVSADLSDRSAVMRAVEGSSIVYLLAGLKYDIAVWRKLWPVIMDNVIEACKRSQAKLLFFDNVYMYGKVIGPMTETTPYNPSSKKGEVRARIATRLMEEVKAGHITAIIARAADFYGPAVANSAANLLVFAPLAKRSTPSWLVNANVPHSMTYTPDAARGVAMLASRATAWNQVWHLPTTPAPPTGREFIAMAAREFRAKPKFRVLGRPMIRVVGWFKSDIREAYEMLYQSDSPYLFDSTRFAREFGFSGTAYADGVRITAASYK
jgi:nucleoside-diphosphate-sugar epimerase